MKTETANAQGSQQRRLPTTNRELREEFVQALQRLPGGDQINCCIQCGTCSGSCPVSWAMDYSPRQIIALFRAGDIESVLQSKTIWFCSSCYQCAARCPAGIKITDIMYGFKRLAMDHRILPKDFNGYLFSETFVNQVRKYGRNYEAGLIGKYMLRSGLGKMLRRAPSGMKLWLKGRMGLFPDKIRDIEVLRRIIRRAQQMEDVAEPGKEESIVDKVGYEAF